MINDRETYFYTGELAARAMNHGDMATYQFHRSWFNKARRLENAEDRAVANAAWDEGYAKVRRVPAVRGLA